MLLGARQFFEKRGKSAPTARDYVQSGLVAMWDGIENAGWGVHDPNATTWKDLVSGTQSVTLQSTEEITENSVITTSRDFTLIDDVELVANGIDTLTIQRVAGELAQSAYNNAAGAVMFCAARFGWCMYFRHVPSTNENGYGYGPMGYSFAPYFGSFGKGYYSPGSTYGLNSRTMIVGANNNPVSGYEGTYQLPAYGTGLVWGGTSTDVSAKISASTSGRVMNSCIRIYNRALTAAEIAANYAIDKSRFNLP